MLCEAERTREDDGVAARTRPRISRVSSKSLQTRFASARRVPAEAERRVPLRLLDVDRHRDVDEVGAAQGDARRARAKVARQVSELDAHAAIRRA